MKLTAPQRRALEIVRDHGPIGGAAFARLMWPKYDECRTRRRRGYNMRAGSFLSALNRMGFLQYEHWSGMYGPIEYHLSGLGKTMLAAAEEEGSMRLLWQYKRMALLVAWYDFWIGAYYDRHHRWLYVVLVPMFPLRFDFGRRPLHSAEAEEEG